MNNLERNEAGPATVIKYFESNLEASTADARALFDYGDALRQVGHRKDAIKVYNLLSDRDNFPGDKIWLVMLFRGQVYLESGLFELAELDLRKSVLLNSKSTVPYVYLSAALSSQEKFIEAESVLESAIGLNGDIEKVFLNLGLVLRSMGRLEEAANKIQSSLDIDSDSITANIVFNDLQRALSI